jgi:ubiquitin-like 1-activating enzyme E1 B
VCTIRQKPEKLIHCIVWAKALYEGLFGAQTSGFVEGIIEELEAAKSSDAYAQILFSRLFNHEVVHLIDHNMMRMNTDIPAEEKAEIQQFCGKLRPIDFEQFKDEITINQMNPDYVLNGTISSDPELSQKVLQHNEWVYLFVNAVSKVNRYRKDQLGTLTFNKDDELAVEFVAAAANLRAFNFAIALESLFKVKEMAGKIVPAISSSNGLVAALQTFEAIKLLAG